MKDGRSIASAALLLSAAILLSRLLGYGREMLLAWRFGAGAEVDAFYAAFQIPDLLNYFLAGGALSIALIPLYNKTALREGQGAADAFAGTVLGTLGLAAAAAAAVLWWKAPELVALQFPKFAPETAALATELTRIVLPAQVFFIAGGIVQGVLLARRRFAAAALAPLVYNAGTILGGIFLYDLCGIAGFAWGTLAGALAGPFLIPFWQARREGIALHARIAPLDARFRTYLLVAAPLMLGQTLLTLDEWYGRWFGALLDPGTVAQLGYARRLMLVPVAVIGQALAAAALPALSALWAEGKTEEMSAALDRTLRAGIFLAVAAAGGFIALSGPLVSLVYEQGRFTAEDAARVAALTAIMALAIPAWITQQIAVRGFYARGDTWRPMVLGTAVSVAAIPLYLLLSRRMGAEGIAAAGAVGMAVSAAATLLLSRRLHPGAPRLARLAASFGHSAVLCAPAALAAAWVSGFDFGNMSLSPKINTLIELSLCGAVYALLLLAAVGKYGEEDARRVLKRLVLRRGKTG